MQVCTAANSIECLQMYFQEICPDSLALVFAGKDKGRSGEGSAEGAPVAKARAARKPKQLQRPIIAICNDLYAAALRPLRFAARSVQLKKPLVSYFEIALVLIAGRTDIALMSHAVYSAWVTRYCCLERVTLCSCY